MTTATDEILQPLEQPFGQQVGESPRLATAGMTLDDLNDVLRMYNDVTQKLQVSHERLQEEVVRLREQLEEKNRELELKKRLAALGEMAAGMAHEIRNPLGGIQLYASSLATDVADRPAAADLVRKISSGVRHLNSLVCDILAFTHQVHCEKADEDIGEIVEAAVELAQPRLMQFNVTAEIGPGIKTLRGRVDGRLLGRALLNLILNAADAVGEASKDRRTIRVYGGPLDEGIELVVEDNGPGIPAASLDRIFNPFFTTKDAGTGLGLAIVHRIVEAHGGTIRAENRTEGGPEGRAEGGARFRIQL